MSIDINWDTLTAGPDGVALAEKIKDFIHEKFQTVPLPRFIQSVKVETFDFGSTAPEVEIKDVCDPLPDFYEDIESGGSESGDQSSTDEEADRIAYQQKNIGERKRCYRVPKNKELSKSTIETRSTDLKLSQSLGEAGNSQVFSTPGIPGGTSNLNYFHNQLTGGLTVARIPLAAVAGVHLCNNWPENSSISQRMRNRHAISRGSVLPTSLASLSLENKEYNPNLAASMIETGSDNCDGLVPEETATKEPSLLSSQSHFRKPRIEDVQTVFRVRYAGDIKLSLTAEILLDYPMPSFVGIPVQLRITGLTFDGVAVLASIRKRVHFCFLSPEDALLATGNESVEDVRSNRLKNSGLLQEIKVESEIGKKVSGKQVLKNVGKVEKFVLEQVRRIVEDEFVYPSFWTFLV